jgi:hypothetical protein
VCCAFFVVVSKFYFLDSFSGRRGEQISNLLISIFILFIQLNSSEREKKKKRVSSIDGFVAILRFSFLINLFLFLFYFLCIFFEIQNEKMKIAKKEKQKATKQRLFIQT